MQELTQQSFTPVPKYFLIPNVLAYHRGCKKSFKSLTIALLVKEIAHCLLLTIKNIYFAQYLLIG